METGSSIQGKKILLGVTGGIAAYKSVYLLRLLVEKGADVQVVMTEAACEFVTPLTFETLSGKPVPIRMFGDRGHVPNPSSPVEHIELARWPDLVVVAPATANTLAKFAHGRADDLLSVIISAFTGTVVVAPAMNDDMWDSQANQSNLDVLNRRGFRMVAPDEGELACGTEGKGRMAEPEAILTYLENLYGGSLKGLRILISAGRTEEPLDPVRYISNHSSGKMGFALAEAARDQGAEVTVVAGRVTAKPPLGVRLENVRTVEEMSRELKARFSETDVLVMVAAVSDFTPTTVQPEKKKGDSWTIDLTRTEDILASLGKIRDKQYIIGFALETENIESNAAEKLKKKNCNLLVVNNPTEEGAGFGHDTNVVTIFNTQGRVLTTGIESKRAIAEIIFRTACEDSTFTTLFS